jgi:Ca2+-binding EF-hand superfamily protein
MSNEEVYFDIPVDISNPLEQRIYDAFTVYDHRNINMVDGMDVGNILRFLGCAPTEEDVKEIVSKTEFPAHPGDVHLSNFMPHLKQLLFYGKMKPSPADDLLKAFQVFDTQNKGFISRENFVEFMTAYGEEMTPEETEQMMKSAVNPADDNVHYEFYINQLVHDNDDSVYVLAKVYVEPKRSSIRKKKMKIQE